MNVDHEEIRGAIAAYALDALDVSEREEAEHRIADHVPRCADCAALLRDFREVAGDLAFGAPPARSPGTLEERILPALRAEGRPRAAGRRWARLAAAAAAVAVATAAALGAALSARSHRAEQRAEALARAVAVAGHPSAIKVTLTGPAGSLLLAYRPGGTAVLFGEGMPPPPAGKTYVLWYLGRTALAARSFAPDGGVVALTLETGPAGYERAIVTAEAKAGVAPTGEPLYEAEIEG